MTITLIDSASRSISSTKMEALDNKNNNESRSEKTEFGQVMTDVMTAKSGDVTKDKPGESVPEAALQALDGQKIAEPTDGMQGLFPTWGGDFLKAVNLGPHLNVITPETAAPDDQSLEAFARSQGLDETAVQWLMGTVPGLKLATPALKAEGLSDLTSASDVNTPSETASDVNTPSETASFNGITTLLRNTPPPTTHPTTPAKSLDAVETGQPMPPTGDQTKTGNTVKSDMLTLNTAALWAMTQPTDKVPLLPTATEFSRDEGQMQINLMRMPQPAAVWMQRNTFTVAPNPETSTSTSTSQADVSLSELDLTSVLSPELLENLAERGSFSAGETPVPSHTGHTGHTGHALEMQASASQDAPAPDTSPSVPTSGSAQRSENIQNLAEKMGQAVGQRILSEIEKGQWHLKLMLRPATLGHIEVEMRMRSGELDAVFSAPQAMTRELLQDGLSKLKDTLNQMGMDVASMHVGDGQTQQRGGDSTPNQPSRLTDTGPSDSKSTASQVVTPPRMKMGQDGWDVLV